MKAGVCPGMPLVQARALMDTGMARIEPRDHERERRALRRLAMWALRFSPTVCPDEEHDGLLLDITGCQRVWRGERRLLASALEGLGQLGIEGRAAIAPTFGCARAVARFGTASGACSVVEDGAIRAALGPLPIDALGSGDEHAARCAEFGIETIGQLLEISRSALPARFGRDLLLQLDRALGQAVETIDPVRPLPPPVRETVLDGPTDRADAIASIVRQLIAELCEDLAARGSGARVLRIELKRSDLGPQRADITLGRPTRDAKALWNLARPKIEKMNLGFGVEAIRVGASSVGRITPHQLCSGDAEAEGRSGTDRALHEFLDVLRNHLGPDRVLRPGLRESHQPERAFYFTADLEHAPPSPSIKAPVPQRPTVLFEPPLPAQVVALTPDGPVQRVMWQGGDMSVAACIGPERISSEWWRSRCANRDYFAICSEKGQWIWIGRVLESGRWFVHGIWA